MEHNTERIYDELLSSCFNGIKQLRDQWSFNHDGNQRLYVGVFNDVGGSDFAHYRFVVVESNNAIKKVLIGIVFRLLLEFEYHVNYILISKKIQLNVILTESMIQSLCPIVTMRLY